MKMEVNKMRNEAEQSNKDFHQKIKYQLNRLQAQNDVMRKIIESITKCAVNIEISKNEN